MFKKISAIFLIFTAISFAQAEEIEFSRAYSGQDLYLDADRIVMDTSAGDERIVVFREKFELDFAGNHYKSNNAVARISTRQVEHRGKVYTDHEVVICLIDDIDVRKDKLARSANIEESVIEKGKEIRLELMVDGNVYLTAEKRIEKDPREMEFYKRLKDELKPKGPVFVIQESAKVPGYPPKKEDQAIKTAEKESEEKEEIVFKYPVNFAPADSGKTDIETLTTEEDKRAVVLKGRFYIWQKLDEEGELLELQSDNAVIFYSDKEKIGEDAEVQDLTGLNIDSVYLHGDVQLTEGLRTIKADELFYDFNNRNALAVNAEYRTFDVKRGIPIYVRAVKIQQIAEDKFSAEDVLVTSSEFHKPQISFTASDILITDKTTMDKETEEASDSDFDAEMHDIRMKYKDTTIFYWPRLRANAERPDWPIKRAHIGNDNTWGTSFETEWYLYRLLGLKEPEGVEGSYYLDYYSERGVGTGAELEYKNDDYFGDVTGYVIDDEGEDRLGRKNFRKDIEPESDIRGRLQWRHRQFLPYNWQLTTGFSYVSDKNFVESYYRSEYITNSNRENYVHMKRIEDNWGLSILANPRLNDFYNVHEDLPSAEYHLIGESLFDNLFTLYSDTEFGRQRQRIGSGNFTSINENFYTYGSHRTEIDMPIWAEPFKVVPYAAGAVGYDDRSGFTRSLVDGRNTGEFGDTDVYRGELGVRMSTQFWKVYPDVNSRLWDLNQIRHIVKPQVAAAVYEESDDVFEQRDTLNLTLSQILQTKRGTEKDERNVDWMRIDTGLTWVNNSADDPIAPNRFIWNRPFVPTTVLSSPEIFNGDLRRDLIRYEDFGPQRNHFTLDYMWRISDTAAILSDGYYDIQSGDVQQFNIGYSRLAWPDLSYYIGSRYLTETDILGEKGSNAFTFSATYKLNERYSLVFGQQFDFDYQDNIRSDITLIRKYHRVRWGLTFSTDESLGQESIVFSIWPQGVKELAIGQRRYVGIGETVDY